MKEVIKKLNVLDPLQLAYIKGGTNNTSNSDDPNIIMDDTDIF